MYFSCSRGVAALVFFFSILATAAVAEGRDQELLDVLRANGSITPEQHEALSAQEDVSAAAVSAGPQVEEAADDADEDARLTDRIASAIAKKVEEEFPVKASYGSKGFRLETRDGKWQTNLQWRAQLRLTYPTSGDPRQVDDFGAREETNFQARRLRMKIGGHGYQPWLKYYFEVDLQPTRDSDEDSSDAAARVIDWRIDVDKWKAIGIRAGQWKIDYNRERVDSSGRQQFVERSIVRWA